MKEDNDISNNKSLEMEIMVIRDSLKRDLIHFDDQVKTLSEYDSLGPVLWGDEFSYVKSLKEEYIVKLSELVQLIDGINENLKIHQKDLLKAEWKVILGGRKD